MSEAQRSAFEAAAGKEANERNVKRLLVVNTLKNGDQFVFSADDIEAMGEMDSAVVNKLAEVAMKLSGIGETDLDSLLKKPVSDSESQPTG